MKWKIFFVFALFALSHIYGITSPLLDHHAWRQCVTFAVARNFSEERTPFLLPKIDWREQFSGVTGTEFPLYSYLVSKGLDLRELFLDGEHYFSPMQKPDFPIQTVLTPGNYIWIGRALTTLFSLFGMLCFFLLMRRRVGEKIAFFQLLALSISGSWFYFSRSVQPDILAVSSALAGLWFFDICVKNDSPKSFVFWTGYIFSMVFFSIGGLVKPGALVLLFPALAIVLTWHGTKAFTKPLYWLFPVGILIPVYLWYRHAIQLNEAYGLNSIFLGRPLTESLQQLFSIQFISTLLKRVFQEFTGWLLAPFLLLGFFNTVRNKKDRWFCISWIFGFFLFAIAAGKHITVHDYYGIPLVPLLCILCGFGIDAAVRWRRKSFILVMVAALVLPLHMKQYYDLQAPYLIGIENDIEQVVPHQARVGVNGGHWPVHLFHLHRKGWSLENKQIFEGKGLSFFVEKGMKYFIFIVPFDRTRIHQRFGSDIVLENKRLMVVKL